MKLSARSMQPKPIEGKPVDSTICGYTCNRCKLGKIKFSILTAENQKKKRNNERTKTCKRCQERENLWSMPGAGKDATSAVPSAAKKWSILSAGKHATDAKRGRICYRCQLQLRVAYFRCALDAHEFMCNKTFIQGNTEKQTWNGENWRN